jgi:hypothetical protein
LCTNVQRRTKYGLNYNGTDFVVNGSSELVARSDWGSNYYGARLEESFIRYQFVSPTGGWAATQKDGTKYYYGQTSNSRQENTHGVFKWLLDKGNIGDVLNIYSLQCQFDMIRQSYAKEITN